jgi:GT2 family glycosyltransferase
MVGQTALSIIVVSWNTKELLRQCLDSLISSFKNQKSKLRMEIIVVDNGSTDGSPKMVKKFFSKVVLLKNKDNLGFGAANNRGMKRAKGKYYLLLNSDTIVKRQALEKMVGLMDKQSEIDVLGCRLLNRDESCQPSAGPFPSLPVAAVMLFLEHWGGDLVRKSFPVLQEVDWVMGAALMIRRETVERVGMMDEGIFMYMDEVEWCYRIKRAGGLVFFWPGAEIVHLGGGSSKSGRREPIVNIVRGLIYFYKKHYPRWQLTLLQVMVKLKAVTVMFWARLEGNQELQQTYEEVYKLS